MKRNMGITDRWIRVVLGIVAIAAGFYFKSWWGLLGVVFLGTALIGTCPLYLPFGISTRQITKVKNT